MPFRPGPAYSNDSDLKWKYPPADPQMNYSANGQPSMHSESAQNNPSQSFQNQNQQHYGDNSDNMAMMGQQEYIPSEDQNMYSNPMYNKRPPSIGSVAGGELEAEEFDAGDDLDGQIRVVIRVRPPNQLELRNGFTNVIQCEANNRSLQVLGLDGRSRPLTFNRVYDPNVSQERFFEESGIKELIVQAIDGYSICVFAFGQTGSGKSFTITGPEGIMTVETVGVVPRSLRYVYEEVISRNTSQEPMIIRASYIEIYNENVYDLLNPKGGCLAVRWTAERGFFVENLLVIDCEVLDDCLAVLEEGLHY